MKYTFNLLLVLSLAAGGVLSAPAPVPEPPATVVPRGTTVATVYKPHCFNGLLPPTGSSLRLTDAQELLKLANAGQQFSQKSICDPVPGYDYNICYDYANGAAIVGYIGSPRQANLDAIYEGAKSIINNCSKMTIQKPLNLPVMTVAGIVDVKTIDGVVERVFLRSRLPKK